MNIITWHEKPPVPSRQYDYGAVDNDTYEPGCPIGWGETPEAAIADLKVQIEERE